MKHRSSAFCVLLALLLASVASVAQQQQPAQSSELYHVHFVKAAPGKLPQLIKEYQGGPAPAAGEPQVTPILLRHREGGDWDLVVITPRGKQATLTAGPAPQELQAYFQRVDSLIAWHGDTFTIGPSWATVQKALVPARGSQPIYVVSDYRALPGHRGQLVQILNRNNQEAAGRAILLAHIEGAPWNFLSITRYDSWAALGEQPAPAGQQDAGLALRDHMAVHNDTITTYVSGGQPIP